MRIINNKIKMQNNNSKKCTYPKKIYDTHMSTNKQTNKQMCVMIKVILGACEWQ